MPNSSANIVACITAGIEVKVELIFQSKYSIPFSDQNVFTYHVRISNENDFDVQLLRRHWWIWESSGLRREVQGEGVIGVQPVIKAGSFHTYESYCPILSSIGKMHGIYQMLHLSKNTVFDVNIPEFQMIVPQIQN